MTKLPKTKKFEVILEMSQRNYPISLLCQIAGVSKIGYYKWLKRQESPTAKQLEDEEVKKKIMECHKKLRGIYGYRRVQVWLEKIYGLHINHKRIQRLMRDRKGNCWDNACMENFFSHFKTECFYLYSFKTAQEDKDALKKYMNFYNHRCFQKKLNNLRTYPFRTQAA
ncbi:IS3 family transposase [Cytobacillus sp. NJ13]|nr:IS3 family transposase [Cytobacillus sp. NJ13]